MDSSAKLDLLTQDAAFEGCESCPSNPAQHRQDDVSSWITHVLRPDGRTLPVLKILQTNACEKDCYYCPMRRGRDYRRVTFTPDELAQAFDELHRRRLVEGLFLSSGVISKNDFAQERIVATAEILRSKYRFRGYIHLKLLPNASPAGIERALHLADRVSVNLEAPTQTHLDRLSRTKNLEADLLAPLRLAQRLTQAQGFRVSRTTQLVVGAAGESDRDIVSRAEQVYHELGLSRIYYSAFRPVPNTPLENLPPTPAMRQHRLYQADFLLRQYGFTFDDFGFDETGNLPLERDPKITWALRHSDLFPVEINRAAREELLRVPGIGPRSADRILRQRRQGHLRDLGDLRRTGADANRAAPFVSLDGRRPPIQLTLWT